MLSINEGTNAMRVYFHTKKRQRSPPESASQTRTSTLHDVHSVYVLSVVFV